MAKWVTWEEGATKEEGAKHYGEGPFMVTSENSENYFVLVPFRMSKVWMKESGRNDWEEHRIKLLLGGSEGGSCKGKCHSKDEPHPLASFKGVRADPKHVKQSPYTSQYEVGDKVKYPGGEGKVQGVTWRQIKVEGVLYDWQHIFPVKEGTNA